MKKTINWMLSASVLLAVGIAGCTRDKTPGGVAEGQETSMELKLVFAANQIPQVTEDGTRVTNDLNAKPEEAEIKTADVFIYSGSGDYLRHEHLTATDFTTTNSAAATAGYDEYASSKAISTTTGPKYFLVGVNLPTAAATSLEGKAMGAASTEIQSIARTAVNTTAGLPMFSTQAVSATMVQDATQNKFTAQVKRIVAKVTVEKSATMVQQGTTGALGPLTWAVNNQNTKYFLMQGAATIYTDPNWKRDTYASTDYAAAVAPTDYVAVNDGPQTVTNYNALYAIENTSETKTQKELTRITVRAWFVPAQWVLTGGYNSTTQTVTRTANSNYNSTTPSSSTPADFWAVTPAVGAETEYFQAQADATAYAQAKGVTAASHPGGICYWNFFLNNGRTGEVVRNDYYRCNITRIVAPGKENDSVTSPDAPPATNTTVTATVQMLNWTPVPVEDKELVP